jgi:hypothetical protein
MLAMNILNVKSGKKLKVAPVVLGLLLFGANSAAAEGGLNGSFQTTTGNAQVNASGGGSTVFSGANASGGAAVFTSASAQGGPDFRSVSLSGIGNAVADSARGVDASLAVAGGSEAVLFEKGGNLIGKSVTSATVEVWINGKKYAVAREVAIAVARATQFGATAAVGVAGSGFVEGGAYSTSTVSSSKGAR